MFAFSTLSLVATLALSAFTSAAPTVLPIPGSPELPSVPGLPNAAAAVPAVPGMAMAKRDCNGVYEVITTVTTTVTPHVYELKYLNSHNATFDVINGIVGNIKTELGGALVNVQGLMGQTSQVILATEAGALVTVAELAQAISALLILVLEALGYVLSIVSADILPCVTVLLATVGELLGCLVCAVIMLVDGILGGLLVALVPLISGVLSIIGSLNIVVLVKILGLSL